MSQRFLAAVSLTGLGFDLFGGLYLAYDLLGGARGPLGIVTRAATYGLVFTIGLTIGVFATPALARGSTTYTWYCGSYQSWCAVQRK